MKPDSRVGLSRAHFIHRILSGERNDAGPAVSVNDLVAFTEAFAGLADPDVMRQAWL